MSIVFIPYYQFCTKTNRVTPNNKKLKKSYNKYKDPLERVEMKNAKFTKLVFFLFAFAQLAGCGAPPVPIATSAPTQTPWPVAVPLSYKGWEGNAFTRVCVDAFFSGNYSNIKANDYKGNIIGDGSALLEGLGMQVVPVTSEECEAEWVFLLQINVLFPKYTGNVNCCSGASLSGSIGLLKVKKNNQMVEAPVGSPWVDDLKGSYDPPKTITSCPSAEQVTFSHLFESVIVKGFLAMYGEKTLDAARRVP
jgi:hypothetical protein